MNLQHRLNRKNNRRKRLARRIIDCPADDKKKTRLMELTSELVNAGYKI